MYFTCMANNMQLLATSATITCMLTLMLHLISYISTCLAFDYTESRFEILEVTKLCNFYARRRISDSVEGFIYGTRYIYSISYLCKCACVKALRSNDYLHSFNEGDYRRIICVLCIEWRLKYVRPCVICINPS